ncbi:hypothetical protein [Pseudomonas putida]
MLRSAALERDLTLADLHRDIIDGFLSHLTGLGVGISTQRTIYQNAKPVLVAIGRRGLFNLIQSGDSATFPRNPFPNLKRKLKGETALTKRERQAVVQALKQAIKPIWDEKPTLTGDLMAYALLTVALYTGRNTTPLLEMERNCLRAHPKKNTAFLVLWKRRGYNSSKVALRTDQLTERLLESTWTMQGSVERLIRRIISLTEEVNKNAPIDIKERVWIYHSHLGITALSSSLLSDAANHLVRDYNLTDISGSPLRLNISRLRKSFANRIFEITDGDMAVTAAALGDTLRVTDDHYLAPSETSRQNWQFMGEILVSELLTKSIGSTYKNTPTGRCSNLPQENVAFKSGEGATCMNFTNCVRCRHYAVTSEDLYKLFSFYFRILSERASMDKGHWAKLYAHIPRLIDNYIVAEGLRRGIFKDRDVEDARARARNKPHPFWAAEMIENLEVFA